MDPVGKILGKRPFRDRYSYNKDEPIKEIYTTDVYPSEEEKQLDRQLKEERISSPLYKRDPYGYKAIYGRSIEEVDDMKLKKAVAEIKRRKEKGLYKTRRRRRHIRRNAPIVVPPYTPLGSINTSILGRRQVQYKRGGFNKNPVSMNLYDRGLESTMPEEKKEFGTVGKVLGKRLYRDIRAKNLFFSKI